MDDNITIPNADTDNDICKVSWGEGQRGSKFAIWEDPDKKIRFKFYRMRNSEHEYRCSKCSSKRVQIIDDVLFTMFDRLPLQKNDLISDNGKKHGIGCNIYIKGGKILLIKLKRNSNEPFQKKFYRIMNGCALIILVRRKNM